MEHSPQAIPEEATTKRTYASFSEFLSATTENLDDSMKSRGEFCVDLFRLASELADSSDTRQIILDQEMLDAMEQVGGLHLVVPHLRIVADADSFEVELKLDKKRIPTHIIMTPTGEDPITYT